MKKYYEVEFANKSELESGEFTGDRCSICIIAEHYPTEKEAEIFCKEDMENMGYDTVSEVILLEDWEAHEYFDMDNEEQFPVLE